MQQLIADILAAMESGRHAEALDRSRDLVQAMPDDESALSLLAVSEQNAGHLDAARVLLERLTREHPETWQHWNNLGNVLRLLGELSSAREAYAHALRLDTGSARLNANLGLLHLNMGDFQAARERLCAACAMPGAEPGMSIWAAVACYACTDDAAARTLIADWRRWPRQSDEAMLELGWLLVQLGDIDDGLSVLRSGFREETDGARALAREALALERLNRLDQAASVLERLPDVDRLSDPKAQLEVLEARAALAMRQDRHAAARGYFETALTLDLPRRYREPLHFGLARACDKLGDAPAAMEALAQAHAEVSPDPAVDRTGRARSGLLSLAGRHLETVDPFDRDAPDSPPASGSPVFVVGFPRSGTTLLEQMLAAQDGFVSMDEQPLVQRMIEWVRKQGFDYPGDLHRLTAADRSALRSLYWQQARQVAVPETGVRLIDKHPLNFLALPMIRRVFANAPVIFCVRHPCDAILSSYMQHFRDPRLAALCGSIDRLANGYVRLVQHWLQDRELFRDNVMECRYEDLVTDFDSQADRLGAFLGVEDVSAMRNFSEHALARGFIGTPSYSQVIQPLNPKAIGRWHRYRTWLEPVLPLLEPSMDHWGYDA